MLGGEQVAHALKDRNRFIIITNITKITWAIKHAPYVGEKSTREKECTTVGA